MRKSIVMMSLLAVLMLPVSASALPLIDIEAAVGGWYTSPSGTLAYEPRAGIANDFLDIEDDLNFDDEFALMGRLKVDMPLIIPNIYLMATPMDLTSVLGMSLLVSSKNMSSVTRAPSCSL